MTSELDRLQLALPKRYKLLRELDRGGMSRVYLAREEMPDRDVAIKVFDEKLSAQLGRERFIREVEVTSQLGHPYIVPIHAAGDAEGALYYVMPFVRGESLRDRLEREGRLTVEDALRITEQVAGALAHAHERGVVHRDIKPANILFHGGHAVVADFGIARAVHVAETKGTLTHAGTTLGTPDYMSPEQISDEGEIDERTDIYALGCVLYEMLAGQPPFHSRTRQATLARHLADTVPQLRSIRDNVPRHVEDALRRALSKAPVDRFSSVSAFVRALRDGVGSVGGRVTASPTRSSLIPPWAVSRRLAGVLLVAAALGVLWNVWSEDDPQGVIAGINTAGLAGLVDSVAVTPFENVTGDPDLDNFGRFVAEDATELLQRVRQIRVRESYSVMALWQSLPITPLMDSLNIGSLIRGSVRPRGDSVEVRVEEMNARGVIVMNRTYGPFLREQLDSARLVVSSAIAEEYLNSIGLDGSEARREAGSSPATEAYRAGTAGLAERTPQGLVEAVLNFRSAIASDSTHAPSFAGLAQAYALALYYKYDVGLSSYALAGRGLALADRAVALDQSHDGGYAARGFFRVLIGMEIDEAEEDFGRAQSLAPSRSNAAGWSARIEAQRGRIEQAYDLYAEALALDPQNAGRRIGFVSLALQRGEYDVVVEEAREALELEESLSMAAAFEAWALALDGRAEECLQVPLGVYDLARSVCLQAAGREREARDMIAAAEASFPSTPADYLDVVQAQDFLIYYAFVGDAARATEWLHAAYDRSPVPLDPRIVESALFARVRDDANFSAAYDDRRRSAEDRVSLDRERASATF